MAWKFGNCAGIGVAGVGAVAGVAFVAAGAGVGAGVVAAGSAVACDSRQDSSKPTSIFSMLLAPKDLTQ